MASAEEIRHLCAARVVALLEALRGIDPELAPCSRAKVVAVREQIYFGWERPMATARGVGYVASKYEVDGWWSVESRQVIWPHRGHECWPHLV